MARKISKKKAALSNEQLCLIAKKFSGVLDARVIKPADVETAAWVRLKCQFGCSGFGHCLVCTPYTPTPQQMRQVLDCYKRAILIHCKPRVDVKAIVLQIERTVFLEGAWKAFGLGAGPCHLCKECELEAGQCRHPEQARPAMEACGIDVFTTARRAGFPIEVIQNHSQRPNFYGLVLVD